MKQRLFFIGNSFIQNRVFTDYIVRMVETINTINSIEHFDRADRDFNTELQQRIAAKENIYIITNAKTSTLVGKLLSTLTQDNLVLKNDFLMPSKCETYDKNSYLLEIKGSFLNIIQVTESEPLAKILIDKKEESATLQFFEHPIKDVIRQLSPLSKQFGVNLTFSQVVQDWVSVKVTTAPFGTLKKFLHKVHQDQPLQVIIADDLVTHIIHACIKVQKKVTLAESCTGGLLAYYFTSHTGVSAVFEGSLVTYSNILKENWIAVDNNTLVTHGAVSEPVVQEMCEGALSIAQADYALGISGIAGPDGGSAEKPVGTVVIGLKSKEHNYVKTYHFAGDRRYIQEQSALTALKTLVLGDKKVFFTN